MNPKLTIIAAMAENRCIGCNNTLPWRLKADMQFFRANTTGHTIIMGRHTWDSLGRPLPGRRNIVLSRQLTLNSQDAEVFSSLHEALKTCAEQEKLFIIGGAQIYTQTIPFADELLLSEVRATVPGDAFFPPIDHTIFEEVSREPHPADAENEFAFDFVRYIRKASNR